MAGDDAAERPVRLRDAAAEGDRVGARQPRLVRLADIEPGIRIPPMDLEIVAVGEAAAADAGRVMRVEDPVAVLVEQDEDAHALGGHDPVEQDHVPQFLGRRGDARILQLGDHALQGEIHDLDVAHDVGLDHLQQAPRGLLGPRPHLLSQLVQHERGDEQHAEGEPARRARPRPGRCGARRGGGAATASGWISRERLRRPAYLAPETLNKTFTDRDIPGSSTSATAVTCETLDTPRPWGHRRGGAAHIVAGPRPAKRPAARASRPARRSRRCRTGAPSPAPPRSRPARRRRASARAGAP